MAAIHDLFNADKTDRKRAMFCRFDNAKLASTWRTDGFAELNKHPPEKAVRFIVERLALNEVERWVPRRLVGFLLPSSQARSFLSGSWPRHVMGIFSGWTKRGPKPDNR